MWTNTLRESLISVFQVNSKFWTWILADKNCWTILKTSNFLILSRDEKEIHCASKIFPKKYIKSITKGWEGLKDSSGNTDALGKTLGKLDNDTGAVLDEIRMSKNVKTSVKQKQKNISYSFIDIFETKVFKWCFNLGSKNAEIAGLSRNHSLPLQFNSSDI